MILSAEETQKIETYPEEVKKVISPESDIQRNTLDKRLDRIFNRYILSVNDQEHELNLSECWSLAEKKLQEFEVQNQKRTNITHAFANMDEREAKSTPLQSYCSHGNSSTNQNQGKGKSWKRALGESMIWFLFITILP